MHAGLRELAELDDVDFNAGVVEDTENGRGGERSLIGPQDGAQYSAPLGRRLRV